MIAPTSHGQSFVSLGAQGANYRMFRLQAKGVVVNREGRATDRAATPQASASAALPGDLTLYFHLDVAVLPVATSGKPELLVYIVKVVFDVLRPVLDSRKRPAAIDKAADRRTVGG